MRAVRTEATNFTYLGPAPGVDPLPCQRTADGRVVSVWQPDEGERRAIAQGQNLELHVWRQPPPPVGLAVTPAGESPAETAAMAAAAGEPPTRDDTVSTQQLLNSHLNAFGLELFLESLWAAWDRERPGEPAAAAPIEMIYRGVQVRLQPVQVPEHVRDHLARGKK